MSANASVNRKRQRGTPPPGLFKGRNFMTPEILGYYRVRMGWAELSEGTGLNHEPLFGVTVKDYKGGNVKGEDGRDLSKCLWSKADALEYIESLS